MAVLSSPLSRETHVGAVQGLALALRSTRKAAICVSAAPSTRACSTQAVLRHTALLREFCCACTRQKGVERADLHGILCLLLGEIAARQ